MFRIAAKKSFLLLKKKRDELKGNTKDVENIYKSKSLRIPLFVFRRIRLIIYIKKIKVNKGVFDNGFKRCLRIISW